MRKTTRAAFAAASALALAVTMTACSSDEGSENTASSTTAVSSSTDKTTSASEKASEQVVEFADGWVKATDQKMTGVFGMVKNTGSEEVHLVGVTSDIGKVQELHETVPGGSGMVMRQKEGGFVIPAGGELELKPGGNHIMLMQLDKPITPGQEVTFTLEFADGKKQDVTVSARAFEGGNESYVPGAGAMNMNQHGQEGMNNNG